MRLLNSIPATTKGVTPAAPTNSQITCNSTNQASSSTQAPSTSQYRNSLSNLKISHTYTWCNRNGNSRIHVHDLQVIKVHHRNISSSNNNWVPVPIAPAAICQERSGDGGRICEASASSVSALVLTAPTLATLGAGAGVGIATEWRWWSRGREATTVAAIAAVLLQPASVSEPT